MRLLLKFVLSMVIMISLGSALPLNDASIADSSEQVLTPVGLMPKSSTVLVPNDFHLRFTDDEIQVVHENGTMLHKSSRFASPPVPAPAFASGYVADAYFFAPASTPITSFSTMWKVPSNPTTNNGQTLFLFNGLVPDTSDSILQPVLQWGPSAAGGGPYWQVASWFVGPSSTYYTPLVSVSVGQSLTGVMTVNTASNTYTSSFIGISQSALTISNGPKLTRAYEALETYNVQAKSNYPTGTTAFTNINIVGPSSVAWTLASTPADGLTTTMIKNGGVNAEIDVHYT